jgi:hypothetical protein
MIEIVILDGGKEIGRLSAAERTFSSGSDGFYAGGKLPHPTKPGERVQVSASLVRIGSKAKGATV